MVIIEIFKLFGRIFVNSDQAERDLDNVDNAGEKTGGMLDGLTEKAGTFAVGIAAAGVAAAGAFAVKGIMAANDFQKAMNNLQAETGITNDEFNNLDDVMKNIYANNFGESFEDIGKSMSTVNQQTGQTGKELEKLTTNGLLLRDTFEMEVNESIRAADMMMKTLGDTGEEAYNLIAQGAQWGLDKNGNLLDSINEYSVHFEQIGLDSTDMFNMFQNGAMAGVFDIDKLGDAVKEFGIRVKDGSSNTTEAFKTLGLDAKKLTSDFTAGGEKGKQAFELVTGKINSMKDPVKQNQVGVALFGTMWEDMGDKAVKALTNTDGEITKNKNALEEINKVKYNDIGSAISGIGRQLETGLLIPLGEKVLPKLNEFANNIAKNMPAIKKNFEGAFETVGTILGGIVEHLDIILPLLGGLLVATLAFKAVSAIIGIYNAWVAITETQTIVQWALNSALFANPIGIVIAAVAGLVAAFIILWNTSDGFRNGVISIWNTIKDFFIGIFNYLKSTFSTWGPVALAVLAPFIGIPLIIYKNWDAIKANLLKVWNWIKNTVYNIFLSIGNFLINIWNKIKSTTSTVWNAIKIGINVYINTIKSIILNVFNSIYNLVSSIWNKIKSTTSNVWNSVKNTIGNIVNGIKTAISNAFNNIKTTVSNIAKNALTWGKNIINNLVDGIKSGINKVGEAARKVANKLKDFLGFSSPTKEGPGSNADKWTPNLMAMMESGLIKNMYKIKNASNRAASVLSGNFGIDNINSNLNNVAYSGANNTGNGFIGERIILQINNPKFFNKDDVNKMMDPAMQKLQSYMNFKKG